MSAQAWDQAKLEIWLVVILFAMFISGCSTMTPPNLLDQLEVKGAADPQAKTSLSDLGILRYAHAVLDKWGVRSVNTEVLTNSGAIAVAALSTGAVVAGAGGAATGVMAGLAGGVNFLLQALGIMKPDARANAFSEGGGLILDSEGEYLVALTSKRIYHIPTDRVTPQGAVLLTKVNAAVKAVSRSMVGLLPKFSDMEKLQPVNPDSLPDPN